MNLKIRWSDCACSGHSRHNKGLAHNIIAEAPASFALAGLSMGGIVAMEILAQAPERINRLALMDTNPLAETNEGLVRRDRQIQDVQNGLLKQVIMDEMKPLYLAENPHKQAILDLCMDMALSLGERCLSDSPVPCVTGQTRQQR